MPRTFGAPIGITREGFWASPTANGLRLLSHEDRGVQLLIAMEYPLDELRGLLSTIGDEVGAGPVLLSRFPFQLTIRTAIDTGSEEWIARALDWLEQDRQLLDHATKMLLKVVTDNKAYDQKLRQRADRLSTTAH